MYNGSEGLWVLRERKTLRKPSQSWPSRSPPLAEGEYAAETELRKIQVLIWMSCSFFIGVYLLE